MKAAQIVGSHDPDERNAGATPAEISNGLVGVAGADIGFEAEHCDARMACELARGCNALLKRCKAARIFQRIAWGDEPPDPIQMESFHCNQACGKMRIMRWVKGAAEQTDPHPAAVRRQAKVAV